MKINHKMQKLFTPSLLIVLFGAGCATEQYQPVPANAFPHPAYTTLPADGGFVHETPNQVTDGASAPVPFNDYVDPGLAPPKHAIQGHCEVSDQGTHMPCSALIFKVLDQRGKIISEIRISEKGDFVFDVQYQQGYRLRLKSEDYTATYAPAGFIYPGQTVQIKVRPKAKHSKV